MMKKASFILITLLTIVVLAACSTSNNNSVQIMPLATENPANNSSTSAAGFTSIDDRLAPGILKLEGTNLALTAQQAKALLPLWQQVQTLDTSGSAQASDYTTVYQQIESTLTSDQVNAIQAMSLNQSDIQALMTSLGIQVTPGAFNGSRSTLSPDQLATRTAQGTPGAFNGSRSTLSPDQLATRTAQRTLTPGAPGGGGGYFGGNGTPPAGGQFGNRGMNTMFIAPLIQLLQTRAGS
jgi:uncharacterized lipoprotein YajG